LKLEENYRSTQGILDLSNWLLETSPLRYDKTLTAVRSEKSRPQLLDFDNDIAEAHWIANDLLERQQKDAQLRDHMIITRTAFGARAVESALVENRIPYRFVGGTSLLQAAHVKDLLSLVRSAASHYDELGWTRYLTLWPRIGDATAFRMIEKLGRAQSLPEAVDLLKQTHPDRPQIPKGIQLVQEHWNDPETAMAKGAQYLEPLMKKKYDNWKQRKRDFELLVRLAKEHTALESFMETYVLDPVSAASVQNLATEDTVTLTTVHSAKGVEAPVCYVIRVEPGMYPHSRSVGNPDAEEEERRILYVAMTRAQDELFLTRSYRPYSGYQYMSGRGGFPGRDIPYFFEDLEEDLVDGNATEFERQAPSNYRMNRPWGD